MRSLELEDDNKEDEKEDDNDLGQDDHNEDDSNQGEDKVVNSNMEEAEQSEKADFWSAMNVHNF